MNKSEKGNYEKERNEESGRYLMLLAIYLCGSYYLLLRWYK